jgi:prophage regulatory protein
VFRNIENDTSFATTAGKATYALLMARQCQFSNLFLKELVMKQDEPLTGNSSQSAELRLIRLKEVLAICGKSRSSVYDAIKKGEFPAPIKLHGRSSAWIMSEILQWVEGCIRATRTPERLRISNRRH